MCSLRIVWQRRPSGPCSCPAQMPAPGPGLPTPPALQSKMLAKRQEQLEEISQPVFKIAHV